MFFNQPFFKHSKFIFIIVLLIAIIGASIFVTSPIWSSYTQPLEIMSLDAETSPIFKFTSILPYDHDIIEPLINNTNFSLLTSLHLSLTPNDINTNSKEVLNDLALLSKRKTPIFLSIIQDTLIDNQTYISNFIDLSESISNTDLTNIQLICYPNPNELGKYQNLNATNIGFTINATEDLQLFDKIYKKFSKDTKLFINDNLTLKPTDNSVISVKDINYIYYSLAIKYPAIDTIYNPYVTMTRNKWLKDSKSTLFPLLSSKFITVYEHLIDKPWITTKDIDVSSVSPYKKLSSYDTLSEKVEIIIPPNSTLLKHFDDESNYINYRFNNTDYRVQAYYPYELTLDTNSLPNGINRFKALIYSDPNTIIYSSNVDLIIDNDNTKPRALRLSSNYALDSAPTYKGNYIPILMYHTISDTVTPEEQNSCVETTLFDSQMKALIDNNYTPITFYDLSNYLNGTSGLPQKPILITMDDGYLNNYTLAYPIYKKYNISATLFVSPFYMQEENTDRHFGFAAAREMESSGLIDIESHGYNHTPFTQLSLKDLKYHVSISHGILEQQLGKRDIFTVACPQFRNNYLTRRTLSSLNVNFQITNLAKSGTGLQKSSLKRINVPNTMTPEQLISTIESLTN